MASNILAARSTGLTTFLPGLCTTEVDSYRETYEQNRHRIYSLAFWMTDNEMAAEEIAGETFRHAFAHCDKPTPEMLDRMLLSELREYMPIGALTLRCEASSEVSCIRRNTLRVHLERAIVQLPATERLIFCMHDGEGYAHERVAQMLGISPEESQLGLHQARLRIRELVATMK